MDFPADGEAIGVVARRSQHDPRGLPSGRSGAEGHHVPEPPVGLGMEFVKNHAAWVVAVLVLGIRRQHLHKSAAITEPQLPPGVYDLYPLPDPGGALYHLAHGVVADAGIFLIRGHDIHLGVPFAVGQ